MGNEPSSDGERSDATCLQRQGDGNMWGVRHSDAEGGPVCVFTRVPGSGSLAELCEGGVERLRVLRHPNVLKFISCDYDDDCISMVTEQVVPVCHVVEAGGEDVTAESLVMGWRGVCEGLAFLHDKAGLSHNNLSPDCVYVSAIDSQWKVGGFEAAAPLKEITLEFLAVVAGIRNPRAVPPEDKGRKVPEGLPCHCRDVWALGHMIVDLLELSRLQQHASEALLTYIEDRMLNPDPSLRPAVQDVLKQPWMSNEVAEISEFLSHLTLKSPAEKKAFFNCVAERLHSVSSAVLAEHLVPLLLTPLIMSEPAAIATLWPHLLTPISPVGKPRCREFDSSKTCPLLEQTHFKAHVVPLVLNLCECRDRHVRLLLLNNMAGLAASIQTDDLQDMVLPEVLIGLRDSDDVMVAATLHALADLVPLLGADVILGSSRDTAFTDAQPRLRQPPVVAVGNRPSPPTPLTASPGSQSEPRPPHPHRSAGREQRLEEMRRKREEQRQKLAHKKLGVAGAVLPGETQPESLPALLPSAGQSYSPSVSHDGSHGDGGASSSQTPLSTPLDATASEEEEEEEEEEWEGLGESGTEESAAGGWGRAQADTQTEPGTPVKSETKAGSLLGEEDLQRLEEQASWSTEPDLFAGMEPSFSHKKQAPPPSSSGRGLSSALQYQPQARGEEETGEGGEGVEGWGDWDWGS